MPVLARCSCGYRMELPDDWAGKQGRCPQCQKVLQIPSRAAAKSPPSHGTEDRAADESPTDRGEALTAHHSVLTSRNLLWLSVVVAGVGLTGGGLFLVLSGERADDVAGRAAKATSDDAGAGDQTGSGDVFRPAAQPKDTDIAPTPTVQATKRGSSPAAPDERPTEPQRPTLKGDGARGPVAWRLNDYGVEIPSSATMIEVDGVRLGLKDASALAARGAVPLVLPLGTHVLRFDETERPRVVKPRRWFLENYAEAAAEMQQNGRWSFDRLIAQSRSTLDRFADPLVPHFWGNFYWQEGQPEAAARSFRWAIEIVPTFAPSYFNLAQLAHERGDDDAARRHLRLADLWNVHNAYGLARASAALRAELGADESADAADEPDWLMPRTDELSSRDRDMIAVLESAAEFTPRRAERAKILNNLGAYFEHVGKPEMALEHYRSAGAVLGGTRLDAGERQVVAAILDNLARLCRNADMPEYRRYERMQAMIEP